MRIAFLNWRDSTHPEGGGAEVYAQTVCAGLAARGHAVTLYCADHGAAPRDEHRDGYLIRRRGTRLTVYAAALQQLRRDARHDAFDVVVDTQNGVPFFTPLQTRARSVVLVHHVHREQWPVVFGPLMSRIGWYVEARIAPVVNRKRQYVAVSQRTKEELTELGVEAPRIRVIHNGTNPPLVSGAHRNEEPTLLVLGRLVPHKRVEHAVDIVGDLHRAYPRLRLRVLGDGWWRERIREHALRRGVADRVDLLGFVDETVKAAELDRAWICIAPSVKEGWGLSVVEAASHGLPTVAYHGAGGLSESIVDGVSGVLVHSQQQMVSVVRDLIDDEARRCELARSAQDLSRRYTWGACVDEWETLLAEVSGVSRRS